MGKKKQQRRRRRQRYTIKCTLRTMMPTKAEIIRSLTRSSSTAPGAPAMSLYAMRMTRSARSAYTLMSALRSPFWLVIFIYEKERADTPLAYVYVHKHVYEYVY